MYEKIYIFGAHARGRTLAEYIKTLYPQTKLIGFLINNDEENPNQIDGLPVINIRDDNEPFIPDADAAVYLGIRGIYHNEVKNALSKLGFKNIIPVTPRLDTELRNKYVKLSFQQSGRSFDKLSEDNKDNTTCGIYVVRSAYDKPLKNEAELKPYEKYIYAGAELSESPIDGIELYDNDGNNISARNRQFCELTALYFIWKNAKEDILGLEHYRRRFLLNDEWLLNMKESDADVILPTPLYVAPNIKENYIQRHNEKAWELMMGVLKKTPYEYIRAVDFFESTGCYSPCNMLIAKKRMLNILCEWLFPIIFQVVGQMGELSDTYQNRYPGFLSERLITFFFYEHSDEYKVVYADKSFLE